MINPFQYFKDQATQYLDKWAREDLEEILHKEIKPPLAGQKEDDMKLEVAMIVGPETKQWLVDITQLVERMERAAGGKPSVAKDVVAATDDDEDFGAPSKKATKKAAAFEEEDDAPKAKKTAVKANSFDEDDEEEEKEEKPAKKAKAKKTAVKANSFDEDDEEEEKEEKPAKKAKAKKVTLDDVNDAALAKCEELGGDKAAREKVKSILKKKFKAPTGSISEIDEEFYGDVIEALA